MEREKALLGPFSMIIKTSRTFVSSSVDDASLTCRQLPEHGLAGSDVARSHDVAAHHRVHLHDEGVAVGARPVDQVVLLRRCRCRCRGSGAAGVLPCCRWRCCCSGRTCARSPARRRSSCPPRPPEDSRPRPPRSWGTYHYCGGAKKSCMLCFD